MTLSGTLARWALYTCWLVISSLLLLEVAVRISGYSESFIYEPVYMPYAGAEDIPFIHKPGLVNARGRGQAVFNTDKLGLRSSKASTADYAPRKPDEYRIAIVGDSVTFGEGIAKTEDTYAAVLERNLNQSGDHRNFRVFNFGVSAYSVREMVATSMHRVPEVGPDLIVMPIIPGDFDLSRTGEVDKFGYTYNSSLSGFMGKDSLIKRLLRSVHLVYLVRDLRQRWLTRNEYSDAPNSRTMQTIPSSYEYIVQFRDFIRRNDVSGLVVLLPALQSGFGEVVPDRLNRDGVAYVDLSFLVREYSPQEFASSKYHAHPSAKIHQRIGEELSRFILNSVTASAG